MKKLFLLALALFAVNFCSYAQLKEVRGLLTKQVEYKEYNNGKMVSRPGFEFVNDNNYEIWVDVELWYNGEGGGHFRYPTTFPCNSKSFTLKANESYIWKCAETMYSNSMGSGYYYSKYFYVKYKAYKAE